MFGKENTNENIHRGFGRSYNIEPVFGLEKIQAKIHNQERDRLKRGPAVQKAAVTPSS